MMKKMVGMKWITVLCSLILYTQIHCKVEEIDGGGWKLVRHVPAGNKWYQATDQLQGTDVYGTPCGSLCDRGWSIRFDTINFNEFLFATGDGKKWLIASKDDVTGGYYDDNAGDVRNIIKSSLNPKSYKVKWLRLKGLKMHPWISLSDIRGGAIGKGDILYGGEGFGGAQAMNVLPKAKHNGANVYIRYEPAPVYSKSAEEQISKNKQLTTLAELGPEYDVSFEVFPTGFNSGWRSVFHMTIHNNHGVAGTRIPGIWFKPGSVNDKTGTLHICNAVNTVPNYCLDKGGIPLKTWVKVRVNQRKERSNYIYRVFIAGNEIHDVVNKKPQTFKNVKVYASNPWNQPQTGRVRNVVIKT